MTELRLKRLGRRLVSAAKFSAFSLETPFVGN